MQKFRPGLLDELVADNRFDRLAPPRNPLDHTVGPARALRQVKQHQFTHPRNAVIARNDCHDLIRRPGDAPRKVQRVGPVRIAPVQRPLARTVGIHHHQRAQVHVHRTGIVPAAEHHLPAGQHGRMQVEILIETQLPNRAAVGFHLVQRTGPLLPVPARYGVPGRRRSKYNPPVRQVAGVETVDTLVFTSRYLPQPAAVDLDLKHLPCPPHRLREQQPVSVKVKVDLADKLAALGPIERLELAGWTNRRENGDLVVVASGLEPRVAHVIHRQAELAAATLQQHELVEIQQWIGQKRLAPGSPKTRQHVRHSFGGRLVPVVDRFQHRTPGRSEFVQTGEMLAAIGILHAERRGDILYSKTDGLDIETPQCLNRIEARGPCDHALPAHRRN